MKCVYETSTGLDAHMILNLLEQEGIHGRVDGEYLQGGVGELQAMNFVRVLVDENSYADASNIIAAWESIQPAPDRSATSSGSSGALLNFVMGVIVGALLMYWKLHGLQP